jgi:hypothetical protein
MVQLTDIGPLHKFHQRPANVWRAMSDQIAAAGAGCKCVSLSPPRSASCMATGIGLLVAAVIGVVVYWRNRPAPAPQATQMIPPPEYVAAPIYRNHRVG